MSKVFRGGGEGEVGQAYVVTFDLCVCMKAFPLIWTFKYENHILMIGTFHAMCAYLIMVVLQMLLLNMRSFMQRKKGNLQRLHSSKTI